MKRRSHLVVLLATLLSCFTQSPGLSAQNTRKVRTPPISGNSIELLPAAPAASARVATVFKDINYFGSSLSINSNTPQLPGDMDRSASSLKIENDSFKWTIFWESKNYDQGDDQLWIQGSRNIPNLHTLHRPHGNNNWGDRISAVSFSDNPPDDDNDNRTICFAGKSCADQPSFSGLSAVSLRGGWFVRVCPQHMTASAIVFEAGAAHNDGSHQPWFTWHNNSDDPVAFDLPIDLLYARDVWLKGTSVPWGSESRFCVGYADHYSWQYSFGHDEDHQPDQGDHHVCEC